MGKRTRGWPALAVLFWIVFAHVLPESGASEARAEPVLAVQAFLGRSQFSPGEIDERDGANTAQAPAAFVRGHQPVADALTREGGAPTMADEITPRDAAGPFATAIPSDLVAVVRSAALFDGSVEELLAERFHLSPTLLRRLNPRARFGAGESPRWRSSVSTRIVDVQR